MPRADDMLVLGNEMVSSLEERIDELNKLKRELKLLLAVYEQERKQMSMALRDTLSAEHKQLMQEVAELLENYKSERVKARQIWEDTMKKLAQLK